MSNRVITTYYAGHRDELLGFVVSRLGSLEESEDVVQNVFLRLLTTDKMINETTLPCLVYTIARNLIADYYRRRTLWYEYEHELAGLKGVDMSAESLLSVRDITERIEKGVARLPENCREVYRMYIYGGMKTSEISQKLGDGYRSVEHRLGLARNRIRQYLALCV